MDGSGPSIFGGLRCSLEYALLIFFFLFRIRMRGGGAFSSHSATATHLPKGLNG